MLNLFQHPSQRIVVRVEKQPCVYVLASQAYGTLSIGVTSCLVARLWQHRSGPLKGFASRYCVHRLVRFERFGEMNMAIAREKQLKRWHRQWKVRIVESEYPDWHDLAPVLVLPPISEHGSAMDAETSSV